jgi:transcriptional regulator GlxA family with amidase domain
VAGDIVTLGPTINLDASSAATASIIRLVRGAIKKDFLDQLSLEMALFEFMVAFQRHARRPIGGLSERHRFVEGARAFVLARLPEAATVSLLAAQFDMSRSCFSHSFRRYTGVTPSQFTTEIRIQKAEEMLLDTNVPVAGIAAACGFSNANHFCKAFRRVRHLSPGQFRRENAGALQLKPATVTRMHTETTDYHP